MTGPAALAELSVEMLPVGRGDALLVQYGGADSTGHRILVDGGPVDSGLYDNLLGRLAEIPADAQGRRHIDVLVVTHIDADHIEGVIRLLQEEGLGCTFGDIWFNGWRHVGAAAGRPLLGGLHGEYLGALLVERRLPWNDRFGGAALQVKPGSTLPNVSLRAGMTATLLSPTDDTLSRLATGWERAVADAGLELGAPDEVRAGLADRWWARPHALSKRSGGKGRRDNSAANGSSIALLLEFGGRRLLLTGDAHDDVLTASLRRLRAERGCDGPLHVDAFKVPHHGSALNLSEFLLAEIAVDRYLISTDGSRFDHPDTDAVQLLIDRHQGSERPVLCFNYEQRNTTRWARHPEVECRYGPDALVRLDATESSTA